MDERIVFESVVERLLKSQYLPSDPDILEEQIGQFARYSDNPTESPGATLMVGSHHRTGTTLVAMQALQRCNRLTADSRELVSRYLNNIAGGGLWIMKSHTFEEMGRTFQKDVKNFRHTCPVAILCLHTQENVDHALAIYSGLIEQAWDEKNGLIKAYEYGSSDNDNLIATTYFLGLLDALLHQDLGLQGKKYCKPDIIMSFKERALDGLLDQRRGGFWPVPKDLPIHFASHLAAIFGPSWVKLRQPQFAETLQAAVDLLPDVVLSRMFKSFIPNEVSDYRIGLAAAYFFLLGLENGSDPLRKKYLPIFHKVMDALLENYDPEAYLREPDLSFFIECLAYRAKMNKKDLASPFFPTPAELADDLAKYIADAVRELGAKVPETAIHKYIQDCFAEYARKGKLPKAEIRHEERLRGQSLDFLLLRKEERPLPIEVKILRGRQDFDHAIDQIIAYSRDLAPTPWDAIVLFVQENRAEAGKAFALERSGKVIRDGVAVHWAISAPFAPPGSTRGRT